MLIKLTDIKGNDYWINPIYVKGITQKRNGPAEIHIHLGNSSWGMPVHSIKVEADAQTLADLLSAAMPNATDVTAAVALDEQFQQQQREAAARAAQAGG